MRTVIAFAVLGTLVGGMWLTFELLARAAEQHPVQPWME
jgi:hypothetical protein